jgi:hypothetical protein
MAPHKDGGLSSAETSASYASPSSSSSPLTLCCTRSKLLAIARSSCSLCEPGKRADGILRHGRHIERACCMGEAQWTQRRPAPLELHGPEEVPMSPQNALLSSHKVYAFGVAQSELQILDCQGRKPRDMPKSPQASSIRGFYLLSIS